MMNMQSRCYLEAILATPMVAGMLFGQLCDGLATMLGVIGLDTQKNTPFQMLLFNMEIVWTFWEKVLGYLRL